MSGHWEEEVTVKSNAWDNGKGLPVEQIIPLASDNTGSG